MVSTDAHGMVLEDPGPWWRPRPFLLFRIFARHGAPAGVVWASGCSFPNGWVTVALPSRWAAGAAVTFSTLGDMRQHYPDSRVVWLASAGDGSWQPPDGVKNDLYPPSFGKTIPTTPAACRYARMHTAGSDGAR